MNYIIPGSQKLSFFEEAAIFGARVAAGMLAVICMYGFCLLCVKAF